MANIQYSHINLEYLDLMADGDDSMKHVILGMLIIELPEEIQKMKALIQNQSWTELSNLSHKLKSTLSYVGNEEMTLSNKAIEKFSKNQISLDEIGALYNTLKKHLPSVVNELNVELEKVS